MLANTAFVMIAQTVWSPVDRCLNAIGQVQAGPRSALLCLEWAGPLAGSCAADKHVWGKNGVDPARWLFLVASANGCIGSNHHFGGDCDLLVRRGSEEADHVFSGDKREDYLDR